MPSQGRKGWTLSRRELLKGATVAGASLAMNGEVAIAKPNDKKPKKTAKTLQSQCPYCGVGCGTLIHADKNGTILRVEADALHSTNRGRQCIKGLNAHEPTYVDRLDEVLVRKDMSDPMTGHESKTKGRFDKDVWRKATYEEAEHLVAEKVAQIHNTHGGNSVGLYGSGQLTVEAQWIENQLMKGVLGSNTIEANARTCMTSAVTAYFKTFGSDTPPLSYEDLEDADMFTFWGHNARAAHSILFWRVQDHVKARKRAYDAAKAKGKNPKEPKVPVVVSDPRRTGTVAGFEGDDPDEAYHVSTINGDISVLNAIAHVIVTDHKEAVDFDFLKKNAVGWEKYIEGVTKRYKPEDVEKWTKVDPKLIREIAAKFAAASIRGRKRGKGGVISFWGIGYNQHIHGQHNVISIINLHALTGNIGRKGAGPFSMTGQPNAMGERLTGGLTGRLPFNMPLACKDTEPDHYKKAVAEHRGRIADAWGVTPELLLETSRQKNPGTMVGQFERALKGDVKAMFYMYTTHIHQPDLNNLIRPALTKMFVVAQDIYRTAPNLLYADVVFPAATWGEWVGGTYINSERRLYVVDGVGRAVDEKGNPRKECRSDMDMAIDKAKLVAKLLKTKNGKRKFTDAQIEKMLPYKKKKISGLMQYDPEDVLRTVIRGSKSSDADLTGILEVEAKDKVSPYEQIRRLRGIQWPAPNYKIAKAGGTKRRYMGQEGKEWGGKPYKNFRTKDKEGRMGLYLCEQVDWYRDPEAKKVFEDMRKMGTVKGYYAIDHPEVLVKARDMALPPEMPDQVEKYEDLTLEEMEKKDLYPVWLGLGIVYEHFHTAKTIRSSTLRDMVPEQFVEMHSDDAEQWGIEDGDLVEVITRRGRYQGKASVGGADSLIKPARNEVPRGYVFSPWNLSVADSAEPEKNKWLVNRTSHRAYDPVSGQVDFKKLAARIRKL